MGLVFPSDWNTASTYFLASHPTCLGNTRVRRPNYKGWQWKLRMESYNTEISCTIWEGNSYQLELRPITTGNSALGPPLTLPSLKEYGVRDKRKIKSAYQFSLHTLLGYVFMLLDFPLIFLPTGTTDLQILLTTEPQKLATSARSFCELLALPLLLSKCLWYQFMFGY